MSKVPFVLRVLILLSGCNRFCFSLAFIVTMERQVCVLVCRDLRRFLIWEYLWISESWVTSGLLTQAGSLRSGAWLILCKAGVCCVMMAYVATDKNGVESPGKLTSLIEGRTKWLNLHNSDRAVMLNYKGWLLPLKSSGKVLHWWYINSWSSFWRCKGIWLVQTMLKTWDIFFKGLIETPTRHLLKVN